MSKADALLSKLKTSLPKPTPAPLAPTPRERVRHEQYEPSTSVGVTTPGPLQAGSTLQEADRMRGRRVPVCFSIYESDVQRLDEIRDFMRRKGYRNVSNSEAIRLACRAVQIGDHFVDVYEQMRQEDGRRK